MRIIPLSAVAPIAEIRSLGKVAAVATVLGCYVRKTLHTSASWSHRINACRG